MARDSVLVQDAVIACLLLDKGMLAQSALGQVNALHSCFPDDPDAEYLHFEQCLMEYIFPGQHE